MCVGFGSYDLITLFSVAGPDDLVDANDCKQVDDEADLHEHPPTGGSQLPLTLSRNGAKEYRDARETGGTFG